MRGRLPGRHERLHDGPSRGAHDVLELHPRGFQVLYRADQFYPLHSSALEDRVHLVEPFYGFLLLPGRGARDRM